MEFVFPVSLPTACSLLFKFKNLSPKLLEFKPLLKKTQGFPYTCPAFRVLSWVVTYTHTGVTEGVEMFEYLIGQHWGRKVQWSLWTQAVTPPHITWVSGPLSPSLLLFLAPTTLRRPAPCQALCWALWVIQWVNEMGPEITILF